jgi:4-amino-4-deoxy-L-arabinose transferase-like glycosyltransferase
MKNIKTIISGIDRKKQFIIIFIFAIALPLISILVQDHSMPLVSDPLDYSNVAINILEGKGFHCDSLLVGFIKMPNIRHPLYPLFIATVYFFTNKSILAVRLAQILIHGFTCLVIFLISEKLFKNKFVSFCSAFAWAVYPLAISHSILLLSETFFTFLLSVSILSIIKFSENVNLRTGLFCGLSLGLTVLTKSLILVFLPMIFFWFILTQRNKFIIKIKNFAVVILFLVLTISPWLVRNYIIFRDYFFIASGSGLSFFRYNNEQTLGVVNSPIREAFPFTEEQKSKIMNLPENLIDNYLYGLGWEFIKSHPEDFLKIRIAEFYHFWHLWPASPQKFSKYYLQQKYESDVQNVFLDRSLDGFINKFRNSYFLYFLKILYHLPYNLLFLGLIFSFFSSLKIDRAAWKRYLLLFLLICTFNVVYIFHHGADRYRMPIDPYVFMLGFQGVVLFFARFKGYGKST